MAAPVSKAQLLRRVYTAMKQHYGRKKLVTTRPAFEQIVYAILLENSTEKKAAEAFRRLATDFVDWNEVRVTTARELADVLTKLPEPYAAGETLRAVLGGIFHRHHSLTLPPLDKLTQRDAVRELQRVKGMPAFAVASVVQQTLGGHAVPTDALMRRVMSRLGVCEPNVKLPDLQGSLERLVAKARAYAFCRLVQELAEDVCTPDSPRCTRCPLLKACPTGRERTAPAKEKAKPRKKAARGEAKKASSTRTKKTASKSS